MFEEVKTARGEAVGARLDPLFWGEKQRALADNREISGEGDGSWSVGLAMGLRVSDV